ncbi:MAG: hypothetical protein AABX34_04035 [Nanoarchaeota archaeon]
MKNIPEVKTQSKTSSFGITNLIGLVFILIGILLILFLLGINLPIELGDFELYLQYGAAAGSIIGGISMLFRSKEINIIKK